MSVIAASDVHKRFGRRRVLQGVDFAADAGKLVAILGENGSGKSTFLRILAGAMRMDRGSLERPSSFGYCPQDQVLYPYLTSDEHFDLFGRAYGLDAAVVRSRADEFLERFGFTRYRRNIVEELSGGTKQKLNLALALLSDPPVLLLDEPFASFDVQAYEHFLEYADEARRGGKCILVVTHILFEPERFDSVFELSDGRMHVRHG